VSGLLYSGTININDELLLGPDKKDQSYKKIIVKSIHNKQISVNSLTHNNLGTLLISVDHDFKITKYMSIINKETDRYNTFRIRYSGDLIINNIIACAHINNIYEQVFIKQLDLDLDQDIYQVTFLQDRSHMITNQDMIIINYNKSVIISKIFL